jgi:hypothetical protein
MKAAGHVLILAAVALALGLVRDHVTAGEIPLLILAAALMLVGLRMSRSRAVADRMFTVLIAALAGGAVGFYAVVVLAADDVQPGDVILTAVALPALLGAMFSALAPGWSWRWGLIVSWGFMAFGIAMLPLNARALLAIPLGVGAACAGAFAGRLLRSTNLARLVP